MGRKSQKGLCSSPWRQLALQCHPRAAKSSGGQLPGQTRFWTGLAVALGSWGMPENQEAWWQSQGPVRQNY
eukprot:3791133-Prymnesium_polylepis.1